MVLWQSSLDPFVTVIPTSSPAVLAVSFTPPNHQISFHVSLYLPTAGQEVQFISALSGLDACLEDIVSNNDDPNIFIRGDANVNPKNTSRVPVFRHLLEKYNLQQIDLKHPTYHHFLGQGEFDSSLDVILHVKKSTITEKIKSIVCKLQHPLVQSHHD